MRKFIFILLISVAFNVSSSELKNDDAKALAEQLKLSINSTVAKIMELEGRSANVEGMKGFHLASDIKQFQELGLVLKNGGFVVAITPNSFAEELGFKSGDLLKKITADDVELSTAKPLQLKVGSRVVASVERADDLIELEGSVKAKDYSWQLNVNSAPQLNSQVAVDGNACGRVSVFARPPETKDYYPVLFNQLNDKNVSQGRNILRLSPGLHKIKVNELIDARGIRIRRPFRIKGKIIEINVEPNKTYYLAAEFDSSKRLKSKGEEYWKPIVWKVLDRECEL